ncbi:MAG TPA: hypothetical protein VEY12_09595 [Thermoplasmata archaeon]|nr:hypothetical protein [Thermoplasmata archaeon]
MARRCGVCGFETGEAVCPRCATILLREEARCPSCGKRFLGSIASCDACGAALGPALARAEDEEAVHLLTALPGISETRARALVARGFRDVSDIVRLALPESDIRRGIHHAIARRMLLAEIALDALGPGPSDRCPICGGSTRPGADACATCGAPFPPARPEATVGRKLQEVTEGIGILDEDEDFREMPEEVRRELLDAFGGVNPEDVLRDEYRHQVELWRERGFDVTQLESLLAQDLAEFRERSVRLIRAQILKRGRNGDFRCPLCDVQLEAAAELCGNCGAKFA